MRKCYIEEDGVKYEEVGGSYLLCTDRSSGFFPKIETIERYNKIYPYVLKSEEAREPKQLREIEGKLYYLKKVGSPVGAWSTTERVPVYKKNTHKIIGEWTQTTPTKVICYWIPLTLDMLHKDNNNETAGSTD